MGLRVDVDVDTSAAARFLDAVEAGVQAGADRLLTGANEHAPIEDDNLINSGVASHSGTVAAVSYDTIYAVRQHEQLSLRHDSGREAKWLERAAVHDGEAVMAAVADTVRARLGG